MSELYGIGNSLVKKMSEYQFNKSVVEIFISMENMKWLTIRERHFNDDHPI